MNLENIGNVIKFDFNPILKEKLDKIMEMSFIHMVTDATFEDYKKIMEKIYETACVSITSSLAAFEE